MKQCAAFSRQRSRTDCGCVPTRRPPCLCPQQNTPVAQAHRPTVPRQLVSVCQRQQQRLPTTAQQHCAQKAEGIGTVSFRACRQRGVAAGVPVQGVPRPNPNLGYDPRWPAAGLVPERALGITFSRYLSGWCFFLTSRFFLNLFQIIFILRH